LDLPDIIAIVIIDSSRLIHGRNVSSWRKRTCKYGPLLSDFRPFAGQPLICPPTRPGDGFPDNLIVERKSGQAADVRSIHVLPSRTI